MMSEAEIELMKTTAREVAEDEALARLRIGLADFTAKTFSQVGDELHAVGHISGSDRVNGHSPGGHALGKMRFVGSMMF